MSACIYWRPISIEQQRVDAGHGGAVVETLVRAFGPRPWRLGMEQLATLRGMAAVGEWLARDQQRNPYQQLITAIENDGEPRVIEVWDEY